MKAIFISFNQAFYDEIIALLEKLNIKGYTSWEEVKGRGSENGEPHLGNHTWPTLNSSILTFVEGEKVDKLLSELTELDKSNARQGLRAFAWDICSEAPERS